MRGERARVLGWLSNAEIRTSTFSEIHLVAIPCVDLHGCDLRLRRRLDYLPRLS